MIDLDSLRGIVSRATSTGWQAAYRQDVGALIAEVERLRDERAAVVAWLRAENEQLAAQVAFLRACVPPTHPNHYGYEAWEERLRAEVERERAAVVAWLRDCDKICREWDGQENAVSRTYRLAAACIERGKHRGEEEK